jgi:hypothetical protein
MPEEIVVITVVAITFGSIVTIVKSVLAYRERIRLGSPAGAPSRTSSAEGASLTTSELEKMMRRAVSEATAPLADRMDALELRMAEPRRLPEANVVPDPLDTPDPVPVQKTLGGRTR